LDCPRCQDQCIKYNEWIVKKLEEFSKQKKKYDKEIGKSKTNSNKYYDKPFYETFGKKYKLVDSFIDTFKEGTNCSINSVEGKIDFEKLDVTFSPSSFCKTCPLYGVNCRKKHGKCIANNENVHKGKNGFNGQNNDDGKTTNIDIEMIDRRLQYMQKNLKTFFEKSCLLESVRNQKWTCKIFNKLDVCKINNFEKDIDIDEYITFKVLLERWLKDFLEGYNKSKRKIKVCTKNDDSCIKGCKDKCECVEKWLKKKVEEWRQITQYFNTHEHDKAYDIAYKVKSYFEQIVDYVKKYIDDFENLKTLEEYEDCNGDHCGRQKNRKKKDIVTILLNRLEDKMKNCKTQHEESNNQNCFKTLPNSSEDDDLDDEDDESDEEEEDQKARNNPCVTVGDDTRGSSGKIKSVRQVAKEMQREGSVRHDGDISKLKADAKLGQYSKKDVERTLNTECDISLQHSNRNTSRSSGPCTGKNEHRFEIGTEWKTGKDVKMTENEAYMPPRRQHMCTSNLEYLINGNHKEILKIENGKINHSFLGDVLLAAKKEAEFIKSKVTNNDNGSAICRAMKYSFADIGDIIRGKDLWDHRDFKNLERDLVTIFGKIKEGITDETIKEKYDSYKDNKHIQLRSDWWEANRDQIWKAMQCPPKKAIFPCRDNKDTVPLDDYIPQRLRWMTEWAEWFCKMQKKAYEQLERKCGECRSGKCETEKNCKECKAKCKEYKEKITPWKQQWEKMSKKYKQLYEQAKKDTNCSTLTKQDQDVVAFLKKLKNQNTANEIYSTAEGYVHQELPNMGTSSGKDSDKEYAFREKPHDHEKECNCQSRNREPPPRRRRGVLHRGVRRVLRRRPPPPAPRQSAGRSEDFEDPARVGPSPGTPDAGGARSDTYQPQPPRANPTAGGVARILQPLDKSTEISEDSEDEDGDEVEEEEEEEKEEVETVEENVHDDGEEEGEEEEEEEEDSNVDEEEPVEEEEQQKEEACNIVEKLFENKDQNKKYFDEACEQKYKDGKERYTQWKCTTNKTKNGGEDEVCIPPRRQKLYLNILKELKDQTPQDQLRTALIQCAAIETFFASHKFKKEKEREDKEKEKQGESYIILDNEEELSLAPDAELNSGIIPEEFKRQMFYTLADYRDIFFGKDIGNDIGEVEKKIKNIFPISAQSPDGLTRHQWWEKNAEAIWDAMVCALSYNTDTKQMNKDVKTKLTSPEKNNNYNKVTFKGGLNGNSTKLTDFVKRPTFFRWLEEWGEEFCRKRTDKLAHLKEECHGLNHSGNPKYCSGDGYHCNDNNLTHNNMFTRLNCGDCEKECTNYRKWIQKKVQEFDKHKNKYGNEIEKLKTDSSKNAHDKMFYELINEKNNYTCAEEFLASLNNCKNGEHDKNQTNKIDFNKPFETFSPSTYCKACPLNGVNCDGKNGCITNREKNLTHQGGESTYIDILINDGATKETNNELQEKCKEYGLYKNLKKQKWKCQNINDIYKCQRQNPLNSEYYDDNIPFKILFERWLRDFVEGYNKSKERITRCTNDKTSCKQGCKGNCVCVEEWLKIKEEEWGKIKNYYKKYFEDDVEPIDSNIKGFFEQGTFSSDAEEAKKVVDEENKRDELWGCTGRDGCESKEEREKYGDFITNLISKLQKKIRNCKTQHETSGKTQPCDENTPHSDEEENFEDTPTTDDSQSPKFCPQPPPPPPPMTCVEKVAKELREEAEGKVSSIDDKLKGEGKKFNGDCNKVIKENGVKGDDLCKLDKTYEKSMGFLKQTCNNNGKERFKIAQNWNSKYIRKIGKVLYIPPRREHMCINHLKEIRQYTDKDSNSLLKKIQEAAQHEGDDIIRKLLEQKSCDEHRICDAMKYSFADLGDIIRGTDLLRDNGDQRRIQRRLINAFTKIYSNLERSKQTKYQKDITNLYELRSDWWDANRKEIWKAMTCNAPDDAKFLKKEENGSTTISSQVKCGHNSDPPDYDYIPQPFRWMQEWSEYYCKARINEIEKLQTECNECKTNASSCQEGDGKKCEKCKTKCKSFNDFVQQWQRQFNIQSQTYKELYDKAMKNNSDGTATPSNDKSVEGPRLPRRRGKPRAAQEDDSITIEFLKLVKHKCKDPNISEKYLDKANNCIQYTFAISSGGSGDNNYAFKNPPKEFEEACKCEPPDPLDQCPNNKENKGACKKLSIENACKNKDFNNDDDSWTSVDVKDSKGKNHGVLVPPRRRQLCIRNITLNLSTIRTKEDFKKNLIQSAYTEAYLLSKKYNVQEKAFSAMKYSFADYGDIVKGTDMLDTTSSRQINKRLTELLNASKNGPANVGSWWRKNKTHVWHAMVCGYQRGNDYKPINAIWCTVPSEDNNAYQFLRWFREWTESFCTRRKELYDIMVTKCEEAQCDDTTGRLNIVECTQACKEYENYILQKKQEYFGQKKKYDKDFKDLNDKKDAPYYFKYSTYLNKSDCLHDNFKDDNKWKNPYESLGNETLKGKCQCMKTTAKPVPAPDVPSPDKKEIPPVNPDETDTPLPPPVSPPLPSDEPFDPTILQTTIPFGIALALGSIAFLFMKKKPKSPVDLIRVLDIHKGDYGTPTSKSKNRYIPYRSGPYKGKTYIYMEGDSDSGHYYEDTTDITSSESEYEELDINDIYPYTSPKYKTLIEVVLEPSKGNGNTPSKGDGNTLGDDMVPTTNTFTDEEWNELKNDFISQYIQSRLPMDVPQYDVSTESPMNIGGNVLDDGINEKPFITSIHDRDLYTGEEISYNIHMSTNSMDDPKYVSNNVYSGIDLINDTLSGNQHIDIYDEVLKRKENELFGTKHPKRTSNNNVAKLTNSDPIMNQLDLFHTWLDRHRDMCNTWNTKEELLDKLNEQWNKDNNSGDIRSDNHVLNTDVSIQIDIDENKGKKEFRNMDTILDDIEDDIYYDVYDENPSVDDIPMDHNKVDVPKKVHVEMKILNNTSNGSLEPEFPISDVWNI
ncbi:hypothetical protein PFFVO_06022, partial [Plasmodium falciparum Vietnam Oak-Knoll (FVO)]